MALSLTEIRLTVDATHDPSIIGQLSVRGTPAQWKLEAGIFKQLASSPGGNKFGRATGRSWAGRFSNTPRNLSRRRCQYQLSVFAPIFAG